MKAKIAYVAQATTTSSTKFDFRDENGDWANQVIQEAEEYKEVLCLIDCAIESAPNTVDEEFVSRFQTVWSAKPKSSGIDAELALSMSHHTSLQPVSDDLQQGSLFDTDPLPPVRYSVEDFITALLQQTLHPNMSLRSIVQFWNDRAPDEEQLAELGDFIVSNAVSFYEHCFPNDGSLDSFTATMGECIEILEGMPVENTFTRRIADYFDLEL